MIVYNRYVNKVLDKTIKIWYYISGQDMSKNKESERGNQNEKRII